MSDTNALKDWFMNLVANKSASDYKNVLKNLTPVLNERGIGQQHDSNGVPRGRLFLPTTECFNAAPVTANEILLGVNQNPDCWERVIDVVENGKWVWNDRGGPEYVPFNESVPNPTPVPQPNMVPWVGYNEQGFERLKRMVRHDYERRPQGPDYDVSVWAGRFFHNCYMGPEGKPLGEQGALKPELCASLKIPVDNYYGE
jgi:hypothetical protein